jgi:hypothetical protein
LCRRHGIATATYYSWKGKYGGMQVSDVTRLRELERENARLKQLYAQASMENAALVFLAGTCEQVNLTSYSGVVKYLTITRYTFISLSRQDFNAITKQLEPKLIALKRDIFDRMDSKFKFVDKRLDAVDRFVSAGTNADTMWASVRSPAPFPSIQSTSSRQ